MTHCLCVQCTNPIEIFQSVTPGLVDAGLAIDAMSLECQANLSEMNLTVRGEEGAIEGFVDRLKQLSNVLQVTNLSQEQTEWFVTAQIGEVYA